MIIRRTIPIFLTVLVAACGFFARQQKRFFSLDTIPAAAAPAAVQGIPIGIDAVELPPEIDRREIVVRESDQKLDLRGTQLWAAPLESMVIHTLAFDLAGRAPEGMIVLPGQAKPIDAMRSIYLVMEQFGAGPDPVLVLDARWMLRPPAEGATTLMRHERVEVPMESLASEQIAAAMSRALATLADRIIAALAAQ